MLHCHAEPKTLPSPWTSTSPAKKLTRFFCDPNGRIVDTKSLDSSASDLLAILSATATSEYPVHNTSAKM